MGFSDERDLEDVIREAQNPGKTQKKFLSAERRRKFRKAAEMLKDSRCTFREYVRAIREIEPQEESPEFVRAVELWYKIHGKE